MAAAADIRRQRAADPLDQQGHLIGNQTHVTVGRREHGEAGSVADRHDDQQAALHLHHGLGDRPALEDPGRALGQAGETGGDGGKLVHPVSREACENAIGRPSEETTIACATEGTRSTKFVISQFRS